MPFSTAHRIEEEEGEEEEDIWAVATMQFRGMPCLISKSAPLYRNFLEAKHSPGMF
jgi:hypothetical protein